MYCRPFRASRRAAAGFFVLTTLAAASVSTPAAGAARSSAPREVDTPRGWPPDTTLSLGRWVRLKPGLMLQLRSVTNRRLNVAVDERSTTQAFLIPRFRLWLTASLTSHLDVFVRGGVNSGGGFRLERAYGDFKLGQLTLRAGQFALPIYAEGENVAAHKTLGTDYSATSIAFEPGSSQGAMLRWTHRLLRLTASVTNGLRTGFGEFLDPLNADVALTGSAELLLFSEDWDRLSDFSSFRGQDPLLKLGIGTHYQVGGETGQTPDLRLLYFASDVRFEGWGCNAFAQLVWTRIDLGADFPGGANQTLSDLGFAIQGGGFVATRFELFGRYDHIIADGQVRPAALNGPATGDFRTVTGGLNFYIVPGAHTARLTLEFQYMFDPQSDSLVPVTTNQGILANGDDQWVTRAQLVMSL